MNKWTVYRHKNMINHKMYFGITRRKVEQRWSTDGHTYQNCPYFFAAIQKYGWENFEHKILISNLTEQQAKRWETRLILHYKTNNNKYGYNLTTGGDGNQHTPETIEIIRQSKIGKRNPNYGKYGKLNSFYGKHHRKKSRMNMSKNNWSKKHAGDNSPNAKKIICLEDNNIFACMGSCLKYYKIHKITLYNHCNNRVSNPRFMYYDEYLKQYNKIDGDVK